MHKVKVTEITSGKSFVHECKTRSEAIDFAAFVNENGRNSEAKLKAEVVK